MDELFVNIENFFELALITIFIVEIILLIIATKKDKKLYWISLILLEILSIIASIVLNIYISKNISGLNGIKPRLFGVFGFYINSIMLFITICIKVVKFEKSNKKQNKKNMNPIILIIGVTLICIGTYILCSELYVNRGYKGTTIGTVSRVLAGGSGHFAYIDFEVNGKKENELYINRDKEMKEKDKIEISYFYRNSSYYVTDYHSFKSYYIPCLIIGIACVAIRIRHNYKTNTIRSK